MVTARELFSSALGYSGPEPSALCTLTKSMIIKNNYLSYEKYILKQESPADARATRDSAVIPKWLSAAILDFIEPQIAPFDPPTPKTLA